MVTGHETTYSCVHCGTPLYFDFGSLSFRHCMQFAPCTTPLAVATTVSTGIVR